MANIKGLTGNVQDVDSSNRALVKLPQDVSSAGTMRVVTVDGDAIDVTENNYLRVSTANIVLTEQVDGNSVDIRKWNPFNVSGMTIVQASGFITLNAGQAVGAGAYAILQSIKAIPLYGTLPLTVELNVKVLNIPEANATVELGIGAVSGTSAPTDGAFFRWTPGGGFFAVINSGGTETPSANLASSTPYTSVDGGSVVLPPSPINIHLYAIEIVEDHVNFSVDDVLIVSVNTPQGQAFPFNAGRQAVFARVYNGGSSPSLFPQLAIGQVVVKQEDLNQQKTWAETIASMGGAGYQSPVTPFAQVSNHTNSTSPSSGTLSNTTPAYTTLGGRFQFAAVAGAATDYALFAYQVPANYQLNIKGIWISCAVIGAAIVTPTILEWFLAIDASSSSLATVDGTATWAPRRTSLGLQSFASLAPIGQTASDIVRRFDVPQVVNGGRFVIVGFQMPNGAATTSLVFRGIVGFDAYNE